PRFTADYVFTYNGRTAMSISAPLKRRLDAAMAVELGHEVTPFTIHDVRRSVRTNLPRLRVPTEISEMILGHGKRGIRAVYDMYAYIDEKREALSLWAGYLHGILR